MRLLFISIGFFLLGGIHSGFAQLCTGQLGDPVFNINFGAGSNLYGGALLTENTGYNYIENDNIPEGSYTIERTTPVMGTLWWITQDHTDNGGGYMMVVNSAFTPTPYFFQQKITGLCANTKYELAAWIMNLLVGVDNSQPNITIVAETSAGVFSYNTGIISKEDKAVWKQFGFVFTTPPGGGDVIIKIRNNSPGTPNGNDFALDDITLRPCGPLVVAGIGDERRTAKAICTGINQTLNLTSTAPVGYVNPQFQWQVSTGNGWQDIAGANTPTTNVVFNNIVIGAYIYRLKIWETGTIPSCGVISNNININVVDKPNPQVSSNSPVCPGGNLQLTCEGNNASTYQWTGPGGFTSTLKNPVISVLDAAGTGVYRVLVTTGGDCSAIAETTVSIKPAPQVNAGADIVICEGEQANLHATGGESYIWAAANGITDTHSASPLVSPSQTTLYTVSASNGVCMISDEVKVTVVRKSVADAGKDKKVLRGDGVIINGSISEPGATYYWTPAIYLDDATKLNPFCTPVDNITYTLHVTSAGGCTISTDMVQIRVLEKLIFRNTFTPNGDGINDYWNIGGLITYPGNLVQIFNRYGGKVFESRGYGTAWNGLFNGLELPAGTYYYLIDLPSENRVEKGSVTLIR